MNPDHEHEWGPWFLKEQRELQPGDVIRTRWCECGAYDMRFYDPKP